MNKGKLKILIGISPGPEMKQAASEEIEKIRTDKSAVYDLSRYNLDSIIDFKPQYAVADDLSLGNPDSFRHKKRYQDVIELLDNGINVIATVYAKNIESLKPSVENITGEEIIETVPDNILECADSLRFIDQAEEGGNYSALRESALRYTASILNKDIENTKYKSPPGFLAAISPSPYTQFLIRWTRQSAYEKKVPWMAVYIETDRKLSEEENSQLKKNIKMVNESGAELIFSMDDDVSGGIIRVARQHNIKRIVIGKPLGYKKSGIFSGKNLVDELIRKSGEIDVLVISEHNSKENRQPFSFKQILASNSDYPEYMMVLFWMVLLIGINLYLNRYISYLSVGFIMLAAVSIISSLFKRGPVLFFASLSAILWNFLFLQPRFTFYIDHLEDLFMFLMYFITAFIIGDLTTRLRKKDFFLRKREKNLEELYQMSKILNESNNINIIIQKSLDLLRNIFNVKTAILLKKDDGNLSGQPCKGSDFKLTGDEFNAALWCFSNGRPAGKNTETLSMSEYKYMPLMTQAKPSGVLAIANNDNIDFTVEQENLLLALISQISTSVERNEFIKSSQRIKVAEESERLYQILLNSVSHELKTPITTISTSANGLMDETLGENAEVRNIFTNDIIDASDRLNRLVDNLLGSLRIESEKVSLNLEWYDISELAAIVQKKLNKLMKNHVYETRIDNNIPLLRFDFMLMEHLLTNLIYNAILYTPEGCIIQLKIESSDKNIILSVNDNGPGIPEEEMEKIFRKFYRAKTAKSGGVGLGLSICREIAEIHHGTITAEQGSLGGAGFIVKLPLQRSSIQGEL